MDGLHTPTRRQLCHSASSCLEARSWSWAVHSPQILGRIFGALRKCLLIFGKLTSTSLTLHSFPRGFACTEHLSVTEAKGEEPDFLHNCSPISCHCLPHVGPSTMAFCPLSKGAFYWQLGLSCFFLGGLHNQAPLEDWKQTREISWSLFKGFVCQESAVSLRSCIHRELGKPSPGWQPGDVIWVLWTLSLCAARKVPLSKGCALLCAETSRRCCVMYRQLLYPRSAWLAAWETRPQHSPFLLMCHLGCSHGSQGSAMQTQKGWNKYPPVTCVPRRGTASLQLS